jgi:serine protease AprX
MLDSRFYLTRAWCALALGAMLLAAGAPAYAEHKQVDAAVRRAIAEGRDLPVIVRFKDAAGLQRGKAQKSGSMKVKRTHKALHALSVKANHRALREFFESRDVVGLSYDAPVQGSLLGLLAPPPPPPSTSIEGSGSKVARSRYAVNGAGVTVAVIDSGVKPHTDLPASRIKAFVDFVNGRTTAYDDYGHGTHVAGIVAGTGAASDGQYAGVATAASIVALKVLDGTGMGSTSNVMAALEWVLANHATYGIRVVNLSLGHPIYEPAATDPLVQLVEALTQRGIVVVVSAGNMGRNTLGQTVYGSITSPANAQGAIAVGAADTKLTNARGDDVVASFSSRGPTRYDYFVKPDVLAPGYHIASLIAEGSTLATTYPHLQIGSSYFRLNGTSQAAPVVAGAAALLFHGNPTLTSHTAKAILQYTSQRLGNVDVMSQGAGEVNLAGAVRFAQMVYTNQTYGKRWIRGSRKPVGADLLFGETAYWGRAIVWGPEVKGGSNALYTRLAQWDDNITWGMMLDENIVWGMDDNLVWGGLLDDNIVWGMLDDNLVWGLTDDNIVWGFDDSVGGLLDDNIVWGMDDNIVWGAFDSVMAFSELLIGMSYDDVVDSQSIMTEGEVR